MNSHKDLLVWQKSTELVKAVYLLTGNFPKSELYGITNQIRRAAVSIPSNIAEGYQRNHRPEYIQFLRVSFGSAAELETQLGIAKDLGMSSQESFKNADKLLGEVLKMLNKLIQSLTPAP